MVIHDDEKLPYFFVYLYITLAQVLQYIGHFIFVFEEENCCLLKNIYFKKKVNFHKFLGDHIFLHYA